MSIKREIELECEKDVSQERCGFVVYEDNQFRLIPAENKAEDKKNTFYIPAKEFLHIMNHKLIVAVYHSHNDGSEEPSTFDMKSADIICFPFLIYSTQTNKFKMHVPVYSEANEDRVKELKQELGISLYD